MSISCINRVEIGDSILLKWKPSKRPIGFTCEPFVVMVVGFYNSTQEASTKVRRGNRWSVPIIASTQSNLTTRIEVYREWIDNKEYLTRFRYCYQCVDKFDYLKVYKKKNVSI